MHKIRIAACAVGVAGLAVGIAIPMTAAGASTAPLHVVKTLTTSVIGPLQFRVAGGKVYVADDFTGTLSTVNGDGSLTTVAQAPPGDELAGVSVDPATGAYAYTTNNQAHTQSSLTIVTPGKPKVVANLYAYEQANNPDKVNHYGAQGAVSAACRSDLAKVELPVQYTGMKDTHPYAVSKLSNGGWAVADAGGNDLLKVDASGNVSTLAVLPPQPLKITQAIAQENGVPNCAGVTYNFEPVPTDVEWGPGGLYATTLPGSFINGSLYHIQYDGTPVRVAGGFTAATNVAIAADGSMYVAELGSGQISQVFRSGSHRVVAQLPAVAAIDWSGGHLYASTAPAALQEGPDAAPAAAAPAAGPPHGSIVELG